MKTYRPNDLKRMNETDIRREYSRLKRAANRRLENLEKRNLGTWGERRFASSKNMPIEWIEQSLLDVSRWLREPRHTVRGEMAQRRAVIDALKERGIDYVDNSNFNQFTDFMNKLREQYSEKVFDSSDAVEVFGQMQRLGVDRDTVMEHYDYFAKNSEKLHRLRVPQSERGTSYSAMRAKINRLK